MNKIKDATDGGDGNKSPLHSFNQTNNSQSNENLIVPSKSPSKTRVHPMSTPGTNGEHPDSGQTRQDSKVGAPSLFGGDNKSSVGELPKIEKTKNVYVDSMNMDHENIEKT